MRALPLAIAILLAFPAAGAVGLGGVEKPSILGPAIVGVGNQPYHGDVRTMLPSGASVPGAGTVDLYLDGKHVGKQLTSSPATGGWSANVFFPATTTRGAHTLNAVANLGTPLQASGDPLTVGFAVKPSPPTNVVATRPTGMDALRVTWSTPLDDGGAPIQSYEVWRSGFENGTYQKMTTVDAATFSYLDFAPVNITIWYRVVAVSVGGSSDRSAGSSAIIGSAWAPTSITLSVDKFLVCDGTPALPYQTSCFEASPGQRVHHNDWFAVFAHYSATLNDGNNGIGYARFVLGSSSYDYQSLGDRNEIADASGSSTGWAPALYANNPNGFCAFGPIQLAINGGGNVSFGVQSDLTVCYCVGAC